MVNLTGQVVDQDNSNRFPRDGVDAGSGVGIGRGRPPFNAGRYRAIPDPERLVQDQEGSGLDERKYPERGHRGANSVVRLIWAVATLERCTRKSK